MNKLLSLILSLFFFTNLANCYQLSEAIKSALEKNHNILALKNQISAAEAEYKAKSSSGFLPTINAYVATNPTAQTDPLGYSSKSIEPIISLQISQNLFNYGGNITNFKKNYSNYLAQVSSSNNQIEQIIIGAVNSYLELFKAHKIKNLHEESLQTIKNSLLAEEKKFKLGESNKSELAKAKAKLSSAYAGYIQAKNEEQNSIVKFTHLIGPLNSELKFPEELPNMPNSIESAIEIAKNFNSKLKASYYKKRSAEFAKAQAITAFLPSINFTASFTYNVLPTKTLAQSIAIQANIPIFQAGKEYAAISSARYIVNQNNELHKDAYKTLQEELTIAWNDCKNSAALIEAAKDSVEAYKISLENIKEETKLSLKTINDVMDAEVDLLKAKINLIEAKSRKVISIYKLYTITYGNNLKALLVKHN